MPELSALKVPPILNPFVPSMLASSKTAAAGAMRDSSNSICDG
jgi:hypothetical protein